MRSRRLTTFADHLLPRPFFPRPPGNSIVDYSLLFTNTLLDYIEASGDQATGHDLYAIAEKQFHLALRRVGEDFIYEVPIPKDLLGGGEWHFIDCESSVAASEPCLLAGGFDFEKARFPPHKTSELSFC